MKEHNMMRGRWWGVLVVLLVAAGGCATGNSQTAPTGTLNSQTAPTGTLDKLTTTRKIALGYRESSIPFSYVSSDKTPVGYSVDLCMRIVADLQRQIPDLQVTWVPVTVESRIPALLNGTIDLECGSTTNTLGRQEQVDFSLTTFLTGGSLLTLAEAPLGSEIRSLHIAVIPGTTTEQVFKTFVTQNAAAVQFLPVKDHAEGLAALENRTADAYASDRIILIGLALTAQNPTRFALADRYFSYEPYALMLRRGDLAFRLAVNRVLARLYRSGQILEVYNRWFGRLGTPSALLVSLYAIEGLPE
jgi:glutamate/aspartate transport system substrate-binding protein